VIATGLGSAQAEEMLTFSSRVSVENLFVVLLVIAPPPQELKPPTNPGRFTTASERLAAHSRDAVLAFMTFQCRHVWLE
jgi:hypothetical protein